VPRRDDDLDATIMEAKTVVDGILEVAGRGDLGLLTALSAAATVERRRREGICARLRRTDEAWREAYAVLLEYERAEKELRRLVREHPDYAPAL
jgi:hypothetical protein